MHFYRSIYGQYYKNKQKMKKKQYLIFAMMMAATYCLGESEGLNTDRMLQSTTSSCFDSKCNSCYTSNRNYCVSCSLDTVAIISGNDRLCSGCSACTTTDCSISFSKPQSCTGGCSSGYRTINSSTLQITLCAKTPSSSTVNRDLIAFLQIVIGITVLYLLFLTIRWFCNQSQHKAYSYESVVLPNQPPPFYFAPVQQPAYPIM